MTARIKLEPGGTVPFYTRPGTFLTTLSVVASDDGACEITWHAELCGQPDNKVPLDAGEPKQIDISKASALVTVRNTGFNPVTVWTDV